MEEFDFMDELTLMLAAEKHRFALVSACDQLAQDIEDPIVREALLKLRFDVSTQDPTSLG